MIALVGVPPAEAPTATPSAATGSAAAAPEPPPASVPPPPDPLVRREPLALPGGQRRVFDERTFLVAYYGTAHTGSLGVLGERSPSRTLPRLRREARAFVRRGERLQPVYELIVTVADAYPGPGGDYNHDIARASVREYIRAAHRQGVLLLLDLQPGRDDFLSVARRWEWALRDPWVGLALDPEWRMGPRQVPAHTIGHVRAAEVNRTTEWLARLTREHALPQKLFVLHQFRLAMVTDIEKIDRHRELAMVQHVDGFGNRRQKLATYHAVARPRQFTMGLKLFYDEDRNRMGAPAVRAIRPPVRFVSYQ